MDRILKTFFFVAAVALIPIVPFLVIGELPGERWLSANDDNALAFGLTGSSLLALDVLLPVPSSVIATLMGSRLGFLAGWIGSWLGLMIGNLLGYGVGRLWPQRIAPEIRESPTLILLILSRPVPVFAEALAITAGAARIPVIHVIAACAVGNAFYTAILAANGAAILSSDWTGPGIILPLLLPVVAWSLWRRFKGRRRYAR